MKTKTNQLQKTPEGYIAHRAGEPLFVVERCPADMKATHGNVIALMPVKRIPHPADIAEMLLAALDSHIQAEYTFCEGVPV